MATVTGLTAARMAEIVDASIESAAIVGTHLILTRHDNTTVDAGDVENIDYKSRLNLTLGLLGTSFCFFSDKVNQPVSSLSYSDGELDRVKTLITLGLHNNTVDPDFAPKIVNGEVRIDPPNVGNSVGMTWLKPGHRFNSAVVSGGFLPRVDQINPATNQSAINIVIGREDSTDPLDFLLSGSVVVAFYPNRIQITMFHPIDGFVANETFNYAYSVPVDGKLNKAMSCRIVGDDTLYVTGPTGEVFKSIDNRYGELWADGSFSGCVFALNRPYSTLATDPEPRLSGISLGESGEHEILKKSIYTPTALHGDVNGEIYALPYAVPVTDDVFVFEAGVNHVKKRVPIQDLAVPGVAGPAGAGVPIGGATGQILAKASGTNYDTLWSTFLRAIQLTTETTNYALISGDEEDMLLIDNTNVRTVTVPTNATVAFPLGTRVRVAQINTGTVSIVGAAGVTLRYSAPLTPTLLGRGATVELIKIGTDEWILDGHGNLAKTDLGWQTYVPNIFATTSGPNLGTSPVQKGFYIVDSQKRVMGGATVRWDTSGTPNMGNGTYRLTLPVAGVNYDDDGYSPIGGASVGVGFVHTECMLHFNGITPSTSSAIAAMQGGLFVTHNTPPGTKGNVHWHFTYQEA